MNKLYPLALALLLIGCGGRPVKTLAEAEAALVDANLARKCAPEEFAAAERMYAKAQKLADEEKYDDAETAATGHRGRRATRGAGWLHNRPAIGHPRPIVGQHSVLPSFPRAPQALSPHLRAPRG